ncbi:hypothetical protein ACH5RR_000646 [Cinchona calisaya]|uniref:Uncharacterized protein n=1 Tax=Cinchona calisaya TaxID=153742 RepID=A0ABD3B180_9GENT
MSRVQTSNLSILRDGRALLGSKGSSYPKDVVNTIMVDVKPIEPIESGNQDGSKETGEIRSHETLGTNKNAKRNPAKGKAAMTCQDEQRRITHFMSRGITNAENVQILIEGSSSKEILSLIKDSKRPPRKVTIIATEVERDGIENLT